MRSRPSICASQGVREVTLLGQNVNADFEATLDLVRAAGYASAFSFKYSRRPGTPAAAMPRQVAEEVKTERLARLQALLDEQRHGFDRSQIDRTLPVLFEKAGRRPGQAIGRSPYLQSVWVENAIDRIGTIAPVHIVGAGPNSLIGALTGQSVPSEAA